MVSLCRLLQKQVYLGGRLDHRQDVPRHLEEFEELVVPFESLEVHEHGARGVGDVGDVGSVQSSVLCCKCFGRLGKKMPMIRESRRTPVLCVIDSNSVPVSAGEVIDEPGVDGAELEIRTGGNLADVVEKPTQLSCYIV